MSPNAHDLAVELDGVGYRYPGHSETVLTDISLAVDTGEIVTIIGPTGAGKTILLSLLDGRLRGWEGAACVNGIDLSSRHPPTRRQRVQTGFVFQNFALVERRPVRENVLNGRLGRVSVGRSVLGRFFAADMHAVEMAIADVGLTNLENRRVDGLSGGQRQRVAVARCLAQEPDLILADEPINNLDPQSSKDVLGALARITQARGSTLLFTSHQPNVALSIATRVLGLKAGGLVLDSPTCEVTDITLADVYDNEDFSAPNTLRLVV